jgi:hypothetical protein
MPPKRSNTGNAHKKSKKLNNAFGELTKMQKQFEAQKRAESSVRYMPVSGTNHTLRINPN